MGRIGQHAGLPRRSLGRWARPAAREELSREWRARQDSLKA